MRDRPQRTGAQRPSPGLPLPTRPAFWRSPVRGVRFTAVLGLVLLAGITLLFVTGLLSYAAYNPDLAAVNDKTPAKGWLGLYLFDWPTGPHWLYRLTQGVHVTLGIVLVPVLLAKLWSVVPKLFALPLGAVGRARPGAPVAAAARGRGALRVRDGAAQHPVGVPVPRIVLPPALLRGLGLLRRVPRPHLSEAAPGAARPAPRPPRGGERRTRLTGSRGADRLPARRPGRRGGGVAAAPADVHAAGASTADCGGPPC